MEGRRSTRRVRRARAAARMEQFGSPGLVHMTADAALRLHRERVGDAVASFDAIDSFPTPPLHLTHIKSKGDVLTAWCVCKGD